MSRRQEVNAMAYWMRRNRKKLTKIGDRLEALANDAPSGTTSMIADVLNPAVDLRRLSQACHSTVREWDDKARRVENYELQLIAERGPA